MGQSMGKSMQKPVLGIQSMGILTPTKCILFGGLNLLTQKVPVEPAKGGWLGIGGS